MTNPTTGEMFKDNMITFIEDFEDMIEDAVEQGVIKNKIKLLILVKAAIKGADGDDIIRVFLERTQDHWPAIKNKDEDHIEDIMKNILEIFRGGKSDQLKEDKDLGKVSGLISKISGPHLETVREVLTGTYMEDGEEKKIFDDDRKEDMWQVLRGFVCVSLLHVYRTRKPNSDGKYTVPFFPDIRVKDMAGEWNVKLY